MSLMPPVVSDQVVRYTQRMSLEELFCFSASLVSLYFGFSVIMLSDMSKVVGNVFVNSIKTKIGIFKEYFTYKPINITNTFNIKIPVIVVNKIRGI